MCALHKTRASCAILQHKGVLRCGALPQATEQRHLKGCIWSLMGFGRWWIGTVFGWGKGRWRCFDAYMCAVCCSDYFWQSSQGMKVPLNLYLLDSGVWEFDVPWVINWWDHWWPRGAHDSQRTGTHPICLQSPSERFLWPKIQGWRGLGRVVELGLISVFL